MSDVAGAISKLQEQGKLDDRAASKAKGAVERMMFRLPAFRDDAEIEIVLPSRGVWA